MNINNLNKLIGIVEAVPAHLMNMKWAIGGVEKVVPGCGCIAFHFERSVETSLPLEDWLEATNFERRELDSLVMPKGWNEDEVLVGRRYPKTRVIATLKRLRDAYLSTGQVVVDWGPEPGEEPKQVWTVPQVAEVINPALPAELTSLLRNTVEA